MGIVAKGSTQSTLCTSAELPCVERYEHHGVTAELRKTMHSDRWMPPHFHDEYQVILSTHAVIDYLSRRARRRSPVGTLFIAEPGEVHSAEVTENSSICEPLRTFFISPSKIASLLDDGKLSNCLPHFRSPIIEDRHAFVLMLHLHKLLSSEPTPLVKDTALLNILRAFFAQSRTHPEHSELARSTRISRVREFIEVHHADSITLESLSAMAGLSPFHLVRLFKKEYGLPPHSYQIQVRVMKATAFLLKGFAAAQAAAMTGFADQAHFARHFRRIMGVSPGRYGIARARTFKTAR